MKIRVLVLASILTVVPTISFYIASAQTTQDPRKHFRLQIRSTTQAPLHVRGAVWMDGTNTNVTVVDQQRQSIWRRSAP
jgi:hypothetical protein